LNFLVERGYEIDKNCDFSIIEYSNQKLRIRIMQYFRDIYVHIAKNNLTLIENNEDWYSIGWIIRFLFNNNFVFNFYRTQTDFTLAIDNQIKEVLNILNRSLDKIEYFFEKEYASKKKELDAFISRNS
jgi:hypothetical protein